MTILIEFIRREGTRRRRRGKREAAAAVTRMQGREKIGRGLHP